MSSQRRVQRHVLPSTEVTSSRLFLHTTNICQCTHEFSRVSSHFTHRWAYRPVYRETELTGCQSQ